MKDWILTPQEAHQLAELRQHIVRYVPMQALCDVCWSLPCSCPPPPQPSLWRRLIGGAR